jgi:hypothetical protein
MPNSNDVPNGPTVRGCINSFKRYRADMVYGRQFRVHNRGNYPDLCMTSRHKSEQKTSNIFFGTCAKLLKLQRGPVAQLDRAPVS